MFSLRVLPQPACWRLMTQGLQVRSVISLFTFLFLTTSHNPPLLHDLSLCSEAADNTLQANYWAFRQALLHSPTCCLLDREEPPLEPCFCSPSCSFSVCLQDLDGLCFSPFCVLCYLLSNPCRGSIPQLGFAEHSRTMTEASMLYHCTNAFSN